MNKYVVICSSGLIKELGNLTGPVVTPVRLSQETILKIIKSGHTVYEVNPSNHKEKILLTFMNATDKHFNTKLPSYGVTVKNIPEETIMPSNGIEKYIPEETESETVIVDVNDDIDDCDVNVSIETDESFTINTDDTIDDVDEHSVDISTESYESEILVNDTKDDVSTETDESFTINTDDTIDDVDEHGVDISTESYESVTIDTDDDGDIEENNKIEELLSEDDEDFDYELEIDDFKSNSKSGI